MSTAATPETLTSTGRPRPTVLIIGGGPGGIAAGIWAVRLGLHPHLIEARPRLGGQLLSVHSPITDYPGIQDVDGPALAARFIEHLLALDIEVSLEARVASIEAPSGVVHTTSGQALRGDAIIVATGALRRRLGLEGEQALVGRGVSYSVSKDRDRAAGRDAVVVGGGDSAVEGAASLAARCPQVHLVHRSALSARPDFVQALLGPPNMRLHERREVGGLRGAAALESVLLDEGTEIPCATLFIRIGVEPVTGFAREALPCDDRGFLLVDAHQRCRDRVYAVGDVCSPDSMAVSVATGQAMMACKHIQSSWR